MKSLQSLRRGGGQTLRFLDDDAYPYKRGNLILSKKIRALDPQNFVHPLTQYIGGVSDVLPCKSYKQQFHDSVFVTFYFSLVTVVVQIVFGSVSCPANY